MADIEIDFKPILSKYLGELRKEMSEDEARLWIRSKKGEKDFIKYCNMCIALQVEKSLDGTH